MINKLLDKNPKTRITLKEIMNHPWITEFNENNCMNEDLELLLSIKVIDSENLDQDVLLEMMNLGFDVDDIQQELESRKVNNRTATYKILRCTKLKKNPFNYKNNNTNKIYAAKNQISSDYLHNEETLLFFREVKLMSILNH